MCPSYCIALLFSPIFFIWGIKILRSCVVVETEDDDDNKFIAISNAVPFFLVGAMLFFVGSGNAALFFKPGVKSQAELSPVIFVSLIVCLLVFVGVYYKIIVPWRLTRWAERRGFKLLSHETTKGLFWTNAVTGRSKYQSFYTLYLQSSDRKKVKADVVIGSYWGTNPNKFQVDWER